MNMFFVFSLIPAHIEEVGVYSWHKARVYVLETKHQTTVLGGTPALSSNSLMMYNPHVHPQ